MYSFTKSPYTAFLGCSGMDGACPRMCPGAELEPEPTPVPAPYQHFSQKLSAPLSLITITILITMMDRTGYSLQNHGPSFELKPGSRAHNLPCPLCHLYATVSSCILVPH